MDLQQYPDVAALAAAVAAMIADLVRSKPDAVIGWPSGRTTVPVLAALREAAPASGDLPGVTIAMMDDYVVEEDGGFARPTADRHFSCAHWVDTTLLPSWPGEPVVLIPDPADPAAYERELAARGGVDLFLAGIGGSDGHVAFNPPGTPLESRTRLVRLADSTRRDNMGTFPEFATLDEVPTRGVSVGLGTILDARRVVALAHGSGKADVVRRVLAAEGFHPELPASFLHADPRAALLVADLGEDLA